LHTVADYERCNTDKDDQKDESQVRVLGAHLLRCHRHDPSIEPHIRRSTQAIGGRQVAALAVASVATIEQAEPSLDLHGLSAADVRLAVRVHLRQSALHANLKRIVVAFERIDVGLAVMLSIRAEVQEEGSIINAAVANGDIDWVRAAFVTVSAYATQPNREQAEADARNKQPSLHL
jgi:hypothetical protein